MKNATLIILLLFIVLVAGFSAGQKTSPNRYEIVFGQIKEELWDVRTNQAGKGKALVENRQICFRLDTATGEIWEFIDLTWFSDSKQDRFKGFVKGPFEIQVTLSEEMRPEGK